MALRIYSSSTDPIMPEQSEMISQFQPHVAAQLVPVKLTEDNYLLWKSLLVPVLKNHDMFNMVQGIEQPLIDDKDQKCLCFIKLTLSEAMLSYAAEALSSRALWLKLEEQGEVVKLRVIQLSSRLKNLKKGRLWVSDYYQSAKQLAEKLKAAGSPVADGDFVKYVLDGLPSDYVAFANSIRAGDTGADALPMTPEELHDLLVAEETSRRRQRCLKVIKYGALFSVGYMLGYMVGWDNGFDVGRGVKVV